MSKKADVKVGTAVIPTKVSLNGSAAAAAKGVKESNAPKIAGEHGR